MPDIHARIVAGAPRWVWILVLILLCASAGSGYLLYRGHASRDTALREAVQRAERVRQRYLETRERYQAQQAELRGRIVASRDRSRAIDARLRRIEEAGRHVRPSESRDETVARFQALGYAPTP